MRFEISKESFEPLYAQIARQVREAFEGGELLPGEQLPPGLVLARELGLSVATVNRAYGELKRAGVVYSRHRKGTFAGPESDAAPEGTLARKRYLRCMDRLLDAAAECDLSLGHVLSELRLRAGVLKARREWKG